MSEGSSDSNINTNISMRPEDRPLPEVNQHQLNGNRQPLTHSSLSLSLSPSALKATENSSPRLTVETIQLENVLDALRKKRRESTRVINHSKSASAKIQRQKRSPHATVDSSKLSNNPLFQGTSTALIELEEILGHENKPSESKSLPASPILPHRDPRHVNGYHHPPSKSIHNEKQVEGETGIVECLYNIQKKMEDLEKKIDRKEAETNKRLCKIEQMLETLLSQNLSTVKYNSQN
eukprot:TRINITY_DN26147_c0_g1_i1.p1 TRINITY_DN26147_c0_g1~~TRINITY_DN26147_c0_g1_i1.p1  ORF type:complete len:236 (-),score=15.78 TRINITY_DN26147_c0_g1_i1:24-731(-)